jgi:hypothetical protein
MNFHEAAGLVGAARSPGDLFGGDPAEARRRYRRLALLVHPDRVDAARRERATEVFARLAALWCRRDGAFTITRGRVAYRCGPLAHAGEIANLYPVGDAFVKIPRRPTDNDLLEREALALQRLAAEGDPRFLPYVPRLVDTFRHVDAADGARRQVNVIAAEGGLRSLVEVRAAYPDGVDPRDAAWMWRRLLVGLGFAHRAGVVHGAVLPEHVLIQPAGHGVVLVDWCYSSVDGSAVPAVVAHRRSWYPAEVLDRSAPGPGTDLAMAARCMTYLMGARIPRRLREFALGCRAPALRQRPDDGWRLLRELDLVLERLYGARTFRPFAV